MSEIPEECPVGFGGWVTSGTNCKLYVNVYWRLDVNSTSHWWGQKGINNPIPNSALKPKETFSRVAMLKKEHDDMLDINLLKRKAVRYL